VLLPGLARKRKRRTEVLLSTAFLAAFLAAFLGGARS
jgi:hypothetical protein